MRDLRACYDLGACIGCGEGGDLVGVPVETVAVAVKEMIENEDGEAGSLSSDDDTKLGISLDHSGGRRKAAVRSWVLP